MTTIKPPMTYFGGKTRLASKITAMLPDHTHYVEPFAGGLSVLLSKRPSRMETVNDLDGDLMNFWRMLREDPVQLARVCALTPHSRAELNLARADTGAAQLDDLERARRVWVRITQARTGSLHPNTGWRHYIDPAGSKTSMPSYLDGYVDRMAAAAQRLHNVSLECRPALDLIAGSYGACRDVCMYVDPPYLSSTRTSGEYQTGMTTGQHEQLLDALTRVQAAVVLSGYASNLYDDALAGWTRVEVPTSTGQGGKRQDRTEVLWCNRLPQPTLFDVDIDGVAS